MTTLLQRRKFLQIAAAGTAAAMPAAAEAATAVGIPQLPLTDEQQLEDCIEELRKILARMHGPMDRVAQLYQVRPNGDFSLWIDGFAPRATIDTYLLPEGGAI